jgi:hypothetical protein
LGAAHHSGLLDSLKPPLVSDHHQRHAIHDADDSGGDIAAG